MWWFRNVFTETSPFMAHLIISRPTSVPRPSGWETLLCWICGCWFWMYCLANELGPNFNSHFSFFLFLKPRLVLFALSLMLPMLHHQAAVCSCFSSASLLHMCPSLLHPWLSARSRDLLKDLCFFPTLMLYKRKGLVEQISPQGTQHYGGNFTGSLHLERARQLTEVNLVIAGSSNRL